MSQTPPQDEEVLHVTEVVDTASKGNKYETYQTFDEVYLHMNEVIQHLGYINLDFSGNLGHTIEFDKDHRKYFELGNKTRLNKVSYFTFEPHIKHKDGEYGYKREDIFYFHNGEIVVL